MSHFLPCSLPSIPSPKQLFGFVLCGLVVFFCCFFFFLSKHILFPFPPQVSNSTTLQLPKTTQRNKNIMILTQRVQELWARASGYKRM